MNNRVCAAGLVAVFGLGSMVVANETAARGFGGRGFAMPPAFHAPVARPESRGTAHTAPVREHREDRRGDELGVGWGFGYPAVVTGGSFDYPYAPSYFGDAEAPPSEAPEIVTGAIPGPPPGYFPPPGYYPPGYYPGPRPYPGVVGWPMVRRPGCRTETVTVPGDEDGKDRTINIVRC